MGLLTVFANFRIDSEERFLRMQDSFRSFSEADIEKWVVNIRGPLKKEAANFLRMNLGERLKLFELESKKGWFDDSRLMLHEIDSDNVFFWIEDHLCVSEVGYLDQIVKSMSSNKIDYLLYSWFHHGDAIRSLAPVRHSESSTLIFCDYDIRAHRTRMSYIENNQLISPTYIISCCSILRNDLFRKLLSSNDPFIKRWPGATPFDFEKAPFDVHWLPFRFALPKFELFAAIDDNHGEKGYALIDRGQYPKRQTRDALLELRKFQLNNEGGAVKRIRGFIPIPLRRQMSLFRSRSREKANSLIARVKCFCCEELIDVKAIAPVQNAEARLSIARFIRDQRGTLAVRILKRIRRIFSR